MAVAEKRISNEMALLLDWLDGHGGRRNGLGLGSGVGLGLGGGVGLRCGSGIGLGLGRVCAASC